MAGDDIAGEAKKLEPILHSNRSASYASLHRYREALADAAKAVELRPDWPKAYSRLAFAQVGLGRLVDALDAVRKGLEIDPANDVIKSTLAFAIKKAVSNCSFPELLERLRGDVRVKGYLRHDDFVGKMTDVQKNPSNIKMYLSDQRVMQALRVLLNVNMDTGQHESGLMRGSSGNRVELEQQLQLSGMQDRAMREKDAGNVAYEKKEFEIAIAHYTRGLELVHMVLSFRTNNQNKGPNSTSTATMIHTQSRVAPIFHHQSLNRVTRNSRVETPTNAKEIRVSSSGQEQNYITYAMNQLLERDSNAVIFKGMGKAIGKTVMVVEQTKRKIAGLHQNTTIGSIDVTNTREPLVEDLLPIHFSRRVSTITIILSKKELDISAIGYQSPLSTMQVNHQTEFPYRRGNYSGGSRGSMGHRRERIIVNGVMANNYDRDLNIGHGWQHAIGGQDHSHFHNLYGQTRANEDRGRGKEQMVVKGKNVLDTEPCNVAVKNKNIMETKPYKCDNNDADDTDDDCIILEINPFEEEIRTSIDDLSENCLSGSEACNHQHHSISFQQGKDEDELSIVAERGKVACRDYPHSRHLCAQHPFDKTPHDNYCSQCYCYVCDIKAPCKYWVRAIEGHCHATERDIKWKEMRRANVPSTNIGVLPFPFMWEWE